MFKAKKQINELKQELEKSEQARIEAVNELYKEKNINNQWRNHLRTLRNDNQVIQSMIMMLTDRIKFYMCQCEDYRQRYNRTENEEFKHKASLYQMMVDELRLLLVAAEFSYAVYSEYLNTQEDLEKQWKNP